MKALGLIFSDIFTRDIPELTRVRTLASVPFGGRYRLIDFALSNMVNSGITNVGIITKYNYQSLMDHVGSGKNWDLSRKNGGLVILPPFNNESGGGVYTSRFEAIKGISPFIAGSDADVVVMSDCDIVCNFDFSDALREHAEHNADFTIIYREKDIQPDDTRTYILVKDQKDGKVTEITDNQRNKAGNKKIYANMLIANRELLLNLLNHSKEFNLKSFTKDILFRTKEYNIYAHKIRSYYSCIDSLANYYKHSMELLSEETRRQLFAANGSDIFTKVRDSAPAKFSDSASVTNSIIADGCVIEGEVKNSILFRDVFVAKGAKVTDSIIFQASSILPGSSVNCVIMDKKSRVLDKRNLSGHYTHPYYIGKGEII